MLEPRFRPLPERELAPLFTKDPESRVLRSLAEADRRLVRAKPAEDSDSSAATRDFKFFTSSARAMRPNRSPRRSRESSSSPSSHFHQEQQDSSQPQQPPPPPPPPP